MVALALIFWTVTVLLAVITGICFIAGIMEPKELLSSWAIGICFLVWTLLANQARSGAERRLNVDKLAKSNIINLYAEHTETSCSWRSEQSNGLKDVYVCRNDWVDTAFTDQHSTVQVTLANDTNQVITVPDTVWEYRHGRPLGSNR